MAARILRCALIGALFFRFVAGQDSSAGSSQPARNLNLSPAARKLLVKPQYGEVELSRTDGRTEKGLLLRVTSEFVAFQTLPPPFACEDIPLSEIAAVRPLPTSGGNNAATIIALAPLFLIFGTPYAIADLVSNPFRKLSPPLNPLLGYWNGGGSHGIPKSTLSFARATVRYWATISNVGRWWIEADKLHLAIGGAPERVTSFHFGCASMVLDDSGEELHVRNRASHATAPIIGDWQSDDGSWLRLKADHKVDAQKLVTREGSFESTKTSVTMHWSDPSGMGGDKWVAHIKGRHIIVSVGGVTTEYHYVPPSSIE